MTARRALGTGPTVLAPASPVDSGAARLLPVERADVDEDQEAAAVLASLRPGAGRERRQLGSRGR